MDTTLLLIIITFVIFLTGIIAAITKYYIRKKGKQEGIQTGDIETGIDNAKDVANNELNKIKENVKSKRE